jgi:hypothetical protein
MARGTPSHGLDQGERSYKGCTVCQRSEPTALAYTSKPTPFPTTPPTTTFTMSDGLPDYLLDYGAVLKDTNVKWRNGRAPDYKRMHADYEASASQTVLQNATKY